MTKFIETPGDYLILGAVALVWNSIVVWVLIGLGFLVRGWLTGRWGWPHDLSPIFIFWGLALLLGYVKLWKDEAS